MWINQVTPSVHKALLSINKLALGILLHHDHLAVLVKVAITADPVQVKFGEGEELREFPVLEVCPLPEDLLVEVDHIPI